MSQPYARRTSTPSKVDIYRICHIENLPSIVTCGEIFPKNILQARGIEARSIAYAHLMEERDGFRVPVAPHGTLNDYVPWSFAARSPMLGANVHHAKDKAAKQRAIVHLVSDVGRVQALGLPFVFTDAHPLAHKLARFENDPAQLIGYLNWEVLNSYMWNKTPNCPDRPRLRQAEFLIHGAVPWGIVRGIGVYDEQAKREVQQIVSASTCSPKVVVLPEWYY